MSAESAWRDVDSGIRRRAEFVATPGGRILAHLHLPLQPDGGAVLICSSTGREQMRHYHREVQIAEALAAAGVAVARFQWRGTGNSDTPGPGYPSVITMEEDVRSAAAWLIAESGASRLALLAESFGSIPAARAAASYPAAPLLLVEPVIAPKSFYRNLHRTRLAAEALDGGAEWALRRSLEEELRSASFADVLGYRLDAESYAVAIEANLVSALGDQPRQVLVVQLDKRGELRADLVRFIDALRQRSWEVDSLVVTTEHSWWFIPKWEADLEEDESAALVPAITHWLVGVLARGAAQGAAR